MDEKKGVCVVVGVVDCFGVGGVVFEGECVLTGVEDVYACEQVLFFLFSFIFFSLLDLVIYLFFLIFFIFFKRLESRFLRQQNGTCAKIWIFLNAITRIISQRHTNI